MSSKIYFFRSVEGLCPDILLERDTELILGRGPKTRIKDGKVSRHQLCILWDDYGISVSQNGDNSSYINGRPLVKGEKIEMNAGQTVYLVSNKYPFKLIMKTEYVAVPADTNNAVSDERKLAVKRDSNGDTLAKSKPDFRKWNHALLASMKDPALKVLETSELVVIKDKYPKAQRHFLVLPAAERLENLTSLTVDHVPLVQKMCITGRNIIDQHPSHQFRLGFHALPSMSQLHLHVISQDFDSPCMKTKKHWNSFTTGFFLNPEQVIDKLKTKGLFVRPSSEQAKTWLNADLKCHKCEVKPKNMPELKAHIKLHLAR